MHQAMGSDPSTHKYMYGGARLQSQKRGGGGRKTRSSKSSSAAQQAPGQLGLREAPLGRVAAGRIVCVDLKKHNLWVRVRQSVAAAVTSRGR